MTRSDVRVVAASDSSREYVVFDALGENYVVDISTGGYSFMYDAVSAAKGLSHTEIDNLVLTHYHIYHPNSIYRLSQAVKLRNIILPAPETADEREIFAEITALLSRLGISHETYVRGETYTGRGVAIDFAPRRNIPRSVKPLVAFCVRAGDASFAYIEGAALEAELDYAEILSAQTVFVGDHGPNRKIHTSADALLSADRVILSDTAAEYMPEAVENAHFEHISESGGVVDIIYKRVFDTRGNK
jgi:hypothetical protein